MQNYSNAIPLIGWLSSWKVGLSAVGTCDNFKTVRKSKRRES